MTSNDVDMQDPETGRFRVVIAGGGVAAVEGLLALRELVSDRAEVSMLAPVDDFVYRPLSVGEPFRRTLPRRFSLWEIARDKGATFHRSALGEIDLERRLVRTTAGTELAYDALLIAIGAQPTEGVPGALMFRGSVDAPAMRELLAGAEAGRVRRVVFTMSDETWWPLAAYELALLTRTHLVERGAADVSVELVTPEARPLGIFGSRASDSVARLLHEAGVKLHPGLVPKEFESGVLKLKGRSPDLACDRAVALPLPSVPPIPGLPEQGYRGLIPTDRYGRVDGAPRVYAAGDATWFPIKQGGIAAQQADAAASAIAALAGASVAPQAFHPVLRGALLTGHGPRFMRSDQLGRLPSQASRSILWWPPSKVAGRLLAPYLFALSGYEAPDHPELTDLAAPFGDDASDVRVDEVDVREMALASADIEATGHRYGRALRWLEVAEDLDLALTPEYEVKRTAWRELARPTVDQPPLEGAA
jgi:sulfide:quinone oxidoreductase